MAKPAGIDYFTAGILCLENESGVSALHTAFSDPKFGIFACISACIITYDLDSYMKWVQGAEPATAICCTPWALHLGARWSKYEFTSILTTDQGYQQWVLKMQAVGDGGRELNTAREVHLNQKVLGYKELCGFWVRNIWRSTLTSLRSIFCPSLMYSTWLLKCRHMLQTSEDVKFVLEMHLESLSFPGFLPTLQEFGWGGLWKYYANLKGCTSIILSWLQQLPFSLRFWS